MTGHGTLQLALGSIGARVGDRVLVTATYRATVTEYSWGDLDVAMDPPQVRYNVEHLDDEPTFKVGEYVELVGGKFPGIHLVKGNRSSGAVGEWYVVPWDDYRTDDGMVVRGGTLMHRSDIGGRLVPWAPSR